MAQPVVLTVLAIALGLTIDAAGVAAVLGLLVLIGPALAPLSCAAGWLFAARMRWPRW